MNLTKLNINTNLDQQDGKSFKLTADAAAKNDTTLNLIDSTLVCFVMWDEAKVVKMSFLYDILQRRALKIQYTDIKQSFLASCKSGDLVWSNFNARVRFRQLIDALCMMPECE